MSTVPFEIRAFEERDRAFVASGWLKSYERSHHTAAARHRPFLTHVHRALGGAVKDAYYRDHGRVVNHLVDRSTTLIATYAGDEQAEVDPETGRRRELLLGFACGARYDGRVVVVHYVYTKGTFRRNGVARALCKELLELLGKSDSVVCSHAPGTDNPIRPLLEQLRWPYVPYPAFIDREGRAA